MLKHRDSILAAYDLGASAKQLQAIFDHEQGGLSPIHLADRRAGTVEVQDMKITAENWRQYVGEEKYAQRTVIRWD